MEMHQIDRYRQLFPMPQKTVASFVSIIKSLATISNDFIFLDPQKIKL